MWPNNRGKPKEKVEYVETCPKCGSRKVFHRYGLSAYTFMGIFFVYECPDCGYKGINVNLSLLEEEMPRVTIGEGGVELAKKSVLRCPTCGSADLYLENAMITGVIYHCKKCDYIGSFVLEEDYSVEDIEEEMKSKEVVRPPANK